jgi:phosphoenolpyruvate---glycerone phosphotransferase subunit DhaL
MFQGSVERVRCEHRFLSELDSATGDGDHGTTMLRAVNQLERLLAEHREADPQSLLDKMAWTLVGIDGGATGPLFGTLFLGMSAAVAGKQVLDCESLVSMFEGGLNALKKQTKARVGDKTLMDALIPAVNTLRQGVAAGKETPRLLLEAAEAAQQGAVSTKALTARFGRAKYLGERTVGYQDPGATTVFLIFQGLYEGLSRTSGD